MGAKDLRRHAHSASTPERLTRRDREGGHGARAAARSVFLPFAGCCGGSGDTERGQGIDGEKELQTALEALQPPSQPQANTYIARGSVFVLRADAVSEQTRGLLASVARVVLESKNGGLVDQLGRLQVASPIRATAAMGTGTAATASARAPQPTTARSAPLQPTSSQPAPIRPAPVPPAPTQSVPATVPAQSLEFFNGLGGFGAAGREYVTVLGPGLTTPAPWVNVITNPHFGFQVAADGGCFTWALNSREHQITPWSNDPTVDRPGEVLYLRDDETGQLWSATAAPIRDPHATYTARHGQGYSRFQHTAREIESELVVFVPMDDPIKISRLRSS